MRRAAKSWHIICTQELTENINEFGKILKWIIRRCLSSSEDEKQFRKAGPSDNRACESGI